MPTPVLVDTVTWSRGANWYAGPFESGGALYLAYRDISPSPDKLAIFKSTDGGANWARQDSGNEPAFSSRNCQGFRSAIITAAYVPSGTTQLAFVDYDCAPEDTYSTPVTGGPTNGSRQSDPYFVFRTDARETRILYKYWESLSRYRVYYVEYDGASWDAGTLFSASVQATEYGFIRNAFIDSSDRIHCVYSRRDASSNYTLYYRRINADGSFSTELQIEASVGNPGSYVGKGSVFGGIVYFPWTKDDELHSIKLGAPDEEPPILDSITLVYDSDEASENYSIVHDGDLWFWWIILDELDPVPADAILYARFNGTSWSDPTVWHDEYANPSYPDEDYQFLHDLEIARLSDDTWGVSTSLEYTPPAESTKCAGIYFIGDSEAKPWAYFGLPIATGEAGDGIGLFV